MITLVICMAILLFVFLIYTKSKEKELYIPTGQYLP